MRVSFFHLRNTKNIGDRWCSPFDHFNWAQHPNIVAAAQDMLLPSDDYDVGVFGGGKILRGIASSPAWRPRFNIGWGISTVHSNPFSIACFRAKRRLNLLGSRDWDGNAGVGGCDWVPCASSEHSFFESPPPPRHKVVVYAHHLKSKSLITDCPSDIPLSTNHHGNLDDALSFLASGETVVSNSYHGVLWALLMGRKVLCAPFSHKFQHYRLAPGYTDEAAWRDNLYKAQSAPDLLNLSRAATATFKAKVWSHIDRLSARS
jgi:hypothetical protein